MRYADTETLRLLNKRAAEDDLMWMNESFFDDIAPGGVHLCAWASPFGDAGTSSHFMTVWRPETQAGGVQQFSMSVRREDLLALAEIPGSPGREFDTAPIPTVFPGFSDAEWEALRHRARLHANG